VRSHTAHGFKLRCLEFLFGDVRSRGLHRFLESAQLLGGGFPIFRRLALSTQDDRKKTFLAGQLDPLKRLYS